MKNKKRAISPLPKGASDKEIIRWAKTHDVFDRLDAGVSELVDDHTDLDRILEEVVFQDNTAQLNMRIPPAMKAALSRSPASARRMRRPLRACGLRKGSNGN